MSTTPGRHRRRSRWAPAHAMATGQGSSCSNLMAAWPTRSSSAQSSVFTSTVAMSSLKIYMCTTLDITTTKKIESGAVDHITGRVQGSGSSWMHVELLIKYTSFSLKKVFNVICFLFVCCKRGLSILVLSGDVFGALYHFFPLIFSPIVLNFVGYYVSNPPWLLLVVCSKWYSINIQ